MTPFRWLFVVTASLTLASSVVWACNSVEGVPIDRDDAAQPDSSTEATDVSPDGSLTDALVDASVDAWDGALAVVTCSKTFGNGIDRLLASDVAVDLFGNIFFTGPLYGTADFGGGPLTSAGDADVYVVKLDAHCNHVWSKRFGDASSQSGTHIRTDVVGNVILAVYLEGAVDFGKGPVVASETDIVIVKLDASGNTLWQKKFGGGGYQSSLDMAVGSANEIVLGGAFNGELDFGGGPLSGPSVAAGGSDSFVAKLDTNGNHVWSRSFGPLQASGPRSLGASSVGIASDGTVYAQGSGKGTIDFGNGPLDFWGRPNGVWIARFSATGTLLSVNKFDWASAQGTLTPRLVLAGRLDAIVDLGTGPVQVALPDGAVTHPATYLAEFDEAGATARWVRGFGVAPSPILGCRSTRSIGSTVAVSAYCTGGGFAIGADASCVAGADLFLRYQVDDGRLLTVVNHGGGPLAVAPTRQFVLAGSLGASVGAPELLTVTKFTPEP